MILCYSPKHCFRLFEGQQYHFLSEKSPAVGRAQTADPWYTRPTSSPFLHGTALLYQHGFPHLLLTWWQIVWVSTTLVEIMQAWIYNFVSETLNSFNYKSVLARMCIALIEITHFMTYVKQFCLSPQGCLIEISSMQQLENFNSSTTRSPLSTYQAGNS